MGVTRERKAITLAVEPTTEVDQEEDDDGVKSVRRLSLNSASSIASQQTEARNGIVTGLTTGWISEFAGWTYSEVWEIEIGTTMPPKCNDMSVMSFARVIDRRRETIIMATKRLEAQREEKKQPQQPQSDLTAHPKPRRRDPSPARGARSATRETHRSIRTARDADEAAAAWLRNEEVNHTNDDGETEQPLHYYDDKAIRSWKFNISDEHRLKGVSNFEYWEASLKRSLLEVDITTSDFTHLPRTCQAVILNQLYASLSPELQRTYVKVTSLQRLWSAIKTNQTRTDTDAQNRAVKAYLEFTVKKGETAAAYIARFKEATNQVRTVGLMGVSLVDMANKFIKGIEPRYSDFNTHLLPIRYGLGHRPEEFLNAAINMLKGLEAEGVPKQDGKTVNENREGKKEKDGNKGKSIINTKNDKEKKDPPKKNEKGEEKKSIHKPCKICGRGHGGECFGKNWKPGQPVKKANKALTSQTQSSELGPAGAEEPQNPQGQAVMSGVIQDSVVDLPSPYYQIGNRRGPASFGATRLWEAQNFQTGSDGKPENEPDLLTRGIDVQTVKALICEAYAHVATNNVEYVLFDTGSDIDITDSEAKLLPGTKVNIEPPMKIQTGGGTVEATIAGSILVTFAAKQGHGRTIRLHDVVVAPSFGVTVIGGHRWYLRGGSIQGTNLIAVNNELITSFDFGEAGTGFYLPAKSTRNTAIAMKTDKQRGERTQEEVQAVRLLHRRLGHVGTDLLAATVNRTLGAIATAAQIKTAEHACTVCDLTKSLRYAPKLKQQRAATPGRGIHVDMSSNSPISQDGSRYIIMATDDFSRYRKVGFAKTKPEGAKITMNLIREFAGEAGSYAEWIRCDNGTDINVGDIRDWCHPHGVKVDSSPANSPAQNGVAERSFRTIMTKARSAMTDMAIPQTFWNWIFEAAVHVTNITASKANNNSVTPYEAYWGTIRPAAQQPRFRVTGATNHDPLSVPSDKPDISHLRILGTKCFVNNNLPQAAGGKRKTEPNALAGILVGYVGTRLYKVWVPGKKRLMISRDVVFHEPLTDEEVELPMLRSQPNGTLRQRRPLASQDEQNEDQRSVRGGEDEPAEASESTETSDSEAIMAPKTNVWTTQVTAKELESHPFFTEVAEKLKYRHDLFDQFYRAFATEAHQDPTTIWAALKTPQANQWLEACFKEITQLLENNTLLFTDEVPEDHRLIDGKWVMKVKRDANGTINKLKGRLVARGFMQIKGVNFAETYASTAAPTYQRILFSLSAQLGWVRRQIDIVGAYLSGKLHHTIYMKQFPLLARYFQQHPDHAKQHGWNERKTIRLGKPLYGLKQAGHEWQKRLREELCGMGFVPLKADRAIYRHAGAKVIVSTHVDDFQIFAEDHNSMEGFITDLSTRLEVTDLGEPEHYLGMRIIIRHDGSLSIAQDQYVRDMLEKYGATGLKPSATPHGEGFHALEDPNSEQHGKKLEALDGTRIRAVIGSAFYAATMTRPDIAYAASVISRGQAGPREGHQLATKRLLKYLVGTPNLGITYQSKDFDGEPGNPFGLVGYSDASFGAPDSKPIAAYLFKMGGAPISWASRKITVVPRSTGEAEYIALSEAAREAAGIRNFLLEISIENLGPITIRVDSTVAKRLAENGEFSARTRHIRSHFHYTRQEVDDGNIILEHVPDSAQLADSLTKPVRAARFLSCRQRMGLEEIFAVEENSE
jgi:hypothetical protein